MKKTEKANIPSNEEIIKMIPSKAVREYLQKIGHQFSERDRYLLWLYLDPKKEDERKPVISSASETVIFCGFTSTPRKKMKAKNFGKKDAMFQFRIRLGGAI